MYTHIQIKQCIKGMYKQTINIRRKASLLVIVIKVNAEILNIQICKWVKSRVKSSLLDH